MQNLIPLKEAAKKLSMGETTLRRRVKTKGAPVYRNTPNGKMYFDLPELVKWIKHQSI